MNDIKLLPCPFCGGEAELDITSTFDIKLTIRCKKCGASLQASTLEKSMVEHVKTCLIRAWNTREPLEQVKEQISDSIKILFDTSDYDKGWNDALEMVSDLLKAESHKECPIKADFAESKPEDKRCPDLAELLAMAEREAKGR